MRHNVHWCSAILVGAMVVAGCGDEADDGNAESNPSTTAGEGPPSEGGDEPIIFESPEGRFRVELPSEPQSNVQSVPSQAGPLEAAVFTVQVSADVGYIVAYTDYPPEVLDLLDPEVALAQAVQQAASNVSGTLESSAKLTVDGYPAVDYVIAVERGRLEARAILTGQRIYLIQRAARQPDQDDFRRLADSFEVLPS